MRTGKTLGPKVSNPNVTLIRKKICSRSPGPLPGSNPHLAATFNHQFELKKSLNCKLNLLFGLASTVCSLPQHQVQLQGVCGQTQPGRGRGWLQGHRAWEDCRPWEMEPHLCGLWVREAPSYSIKSSLRHIVHQNMLCLEEVYWGSSSNLLYSDRSRTWTQFSSPFRRIPLCPLLSTLEYAAGQISGIRSATEMIYLHL